MLSRLRRHLSFANVCSLLALCIALGTGSAYAANTVFSTDIVDGQVKHADIASNAVTSSNVYPASVLGSDIGTGAVDSSKVADNSLTANDLAQDSVGFNQLQSGSVHADQLAQDSVGGSKVSDGSIGADDLGGSAVGSTELAANAVTSAKVADGSLTLADHSGIDFVGTISVPTNTVANGRCRQFDATANGFQAGQVAIATMVDALPEGLAISALRVPAANKLTLNICNFTGGIQPGFSDLHIRLTTLN